MAAEVSVLVLGAPDLAGAHYELWHDDVVAGCVDLGWRTDFIRIRDAPVDDVVRAAKGADVLLWLRTQSHNPRGDAVSMLRRIEQAGTVTVGMHMDLYWGIQARERRIGAEAWWSCQHVYTADGAARDWAGRGVNHHWCPPAFGSRFLGRGRRDATVEAEAVFVGFHQRAVHGHHRGRLIGWAKQRWGSRFLHVGSSRNTRLFHHKLNDLYASVPLVLGDSAPADRYWSDRVPRTLGRGGLLAYPVTAGLAEQGFDDTVLIPYEWGRFDQIVERLDALDQYARRGMTEAAIALVRDRHLWRHRLADIAQRVLA